MGSRQLGILVLTVTAVLLVGVKLAGLERTRAWKVCANETYFYDIRYPEGYRLFTASVGTHTPGTVPVERCDGLRHVVIAGSASGEESLTIRVDTLEDLKQTVYAGAGSLEEYFARNPALGRLEDFETRDIGGVRFVDRGDELLGFHRENLYTLTSSGVRGVTENILSTLSFR